MGVNPFPFHLTPITNLGAYPKSLFGDSNTIECEFHVPDQRILTIVS